MAEFEKAEKQYTKLSTVRDSVSPVWEDCAELTLPYIYPRGSDSTTQGDLFPSPYNSLGPSAVNALSAKLLLALIPPSGPFFRLLPKESVLDKLEGPDDKAQLEKELSEVEQDIVKEINKQYVRVPLFEALKHLIVTGNTLLYKTKGKGFKVFSPHQYVVKRDFVGNLTELIIKETMSYVSLPDKVKAQLMQQEITEAEDVEDLNLKNMDVYTRCTKINDKKFLVYQEIKDVEIAGSSKEYSIDNLPYIPLRWNTVNNEDYGRGLVEQYIGDLRSLEGLTQTIVEGSGIAAQFIFGLRPGSSLNVEDLNNAQNGEFVLGDLEKEISVLQVNKGPDLQVPMNLMQQIEQRLAKAFLMLNGQVRDSERTTAVEVRATINELETTLGGVYTVLASELQHPLVKLILQELAPAALKVADVDITTGISAISREKDYQNLTTMAQAVSQFGPEALQTYMKLGAYFGEMATALGMNAADIIYTDEEIQKKQEAQAQAEQQAQEQQQASQQDHDMTMQQMKQQGGQ